MVGTFGSVVTDKQVRHLAEYEKVILWPDPDEAGWKGVEGYVNDVNGERIQGTAERLAPYTDVRVVESQWAVDPAELPDSEADVLVDSAVPWSIWERPTGALRCTACGREHGGECT